MPIATIRASYRSDPLKTISLLVIAGGSLIFTTTAILALTGSVQRLDEAIVQFLNPQSSLGWHQEAFRDITSLGGYAVLTLVVGTACIYQRFSGRKATMWFLLVTVLAGYVVNMGMKDLFARPRPDDVLRLSFVESSSFPSGHSMMATIVYVTLGLLAAERAESKRVKIYLYVLPILVAALVGISRIYLGVHYPTDVLAGWSAGLVWTASAWLVARHLEQTDRFPRILPETPLKSETAAAANR